MNKTVIVTGGAGFIGSNLIRFLINNKEWDIVNLDKLTYAGNLDNLKDIADSPRYKFEQVDICNFIEVEQTIKKYQPFAIMHLAAESHVDNSINGPRVFIETNIIGTFNLLEAAREYFNTLNEVDKEEFRFQHISTDEVFGSLDNGGFFTETSSYDPSSPYSASKASSDHLVRAYARTYKLPTLITNCSNNYGPYQFPEKLIPVIITNIKNEKKLPVYGKGENVRDWLYVEDHADALTVVLEKGAVNQTYNIGGRNEKNNLELVKMICEICDEMIPSSNLKSYKDLITFVTDRPGHDLRYAIDPAKIENELGWVAKTDFNEGLRKTIKYYLNLK